jgi:hypothetical protein
LQFSGFSGKLFSVSERKNNEMKNEKKKFLNVTFKVNRHPDYTGNHQLAEFDHIGGCTYPLGTTEPEMIREFLAETVVRDMQGKTWTKGEIVEVERIDKCFEDWCD